MIKKLTSRPLYKNPWMAVREDQVEFPGGHRGIYGVVEKPDFALTIPLEEDSVYLVRQYRYPVGGTYWEFPQGAAEDNLEIELVDLARRELVEETGLRAATMERPDYLYGLYGFCTQGFHVFLATGLEQGEQALEASEKGLEVHRAPIATFERLVAEGQVRDGATLSAYALLKMRG